MDNQININGEWFDVGESFINRIKMYEQLRDEVATMRIAQKKYFAHRHPEILAIAKLSEQRVDKLVKELQNNIDSQGKLF